MAPTPTRKRSLFMRGYDRVGGLASLESDSTSSTRRPRGAAGSTPLLLAVAAGLLLLGFFAFVFTVGSGAGAASTTTTVTSAAPVLRVDEQLRAPPHTPPPPPPAAHAAPVTRVTAPPPPLSSSLPRLKVAVAITVTKDGPYLDGAAVLQHSVRMTNSRHDVEMVALVHSEVQSTRPALEQLGYRVVDFPLPILSRDIQGQHLRDTIDKSGCCGAQELLKLCSWRLTGYDRVVAMDMDAIWLANLDHLLERPLPPGGFFFTYDFAMDGPGSRAPPVQGGFQLLRPDEAAFEELVGIVRVGDFRPSTGWGGLRVGWHWGGQTIQGLLAYYASTVKPELAIALDPCQYNSMATTRTCRRVEYASVHTVHYTYCQKPWECHLGVGICGKFLHAWWLVRQDLERQQGLAPVSRCCRGNTELCGMKRYEAVGVQGMKALPMADHTAAALPYGQHIVTMPPALAEATDPHEPNREED